MEKMERKQLLKTIENAYVLIFCWSNHLLLFHVAPNTSCCRLLRPSRRSRPGVLPQNVNLKPSILNIQSG